LIFNRGTPFASLISPSAVNIVPLDVSRVQMRYEAVMPFESFPAQEMYGLAQAIVYPSDATGE